MLRAELEPLFWDGLAMVRNHNRGCRNIGEGWRAIAVAQWLKTPQLQLTPLQSIYGLPGFSVLLAGIVLSAAPGHAQNITLDGTLGAPATLTGPVYTIPQAAGKTSGSTLFHSFGRFGLATGEVANFQSAIAIRNIFGRVTGGNPSAIDGLIRTQGSNVNLFLINPSGILFGPNARLDVSGSFVATTATSVKFPDGSEFSATQPQAAPLLTMAITPGLQYGARQGNIQNAGVLSVGAGQTLTLLGQGVTSTGSLIAPGGRVEVLGDRIALLDRAQINVSAVGGGGTVLIGGDFQGKGTVPNATQTLIAPKVSITADALQTGDGGRVIVWSDRSTRFYGSISAQGGVLSGNGGFAEVSGKNVLTYAGQTNLTAPNGAIGTLLLDPVNITVVEGGADPAQLFANDQTTDPGSDNLITNGTINSARSNVILQASNDITFDAPIFITTPEVGIFAEAGNDIIVNRNILTDGGGISLLADNKVVLNGVTLDPTPLTNPSVGSFVVIGGEKGVQIANSNIISRLNSSNTSKATTSAVGIASKTGSVLIDNTVISTTNFGTGIAGDVVITAQDKVEITNGSDIFSRGNSGRIFIGPADPYEITLKPRSIAIDNSSLDTNNDTEAQGSFDAGGISISAEDAVSLSNSSRIRSSTFRQGNPGVVFLSTEGGKVSITGGSEIFTQVTAKGVATSTSSSGFAGGVFDALLGQSDGDISGATFVATGSLVIDGTDSFISASTFGKGNAGAVVVLASGDVSLRNGGKIISRSGDGAQGNAGGIIIGANSLLLSGSRSQLVTETNGQGDAGIILVAANRRIDVSGRGSGIFSSAVSNTPQEAGAIFLSAGRSLSVRNGAGVSVSNVGPGGGSAGSIFVTAKAVWVDNGGLISAVSSTGNGGDLFFETAAIVLTSQGDISTTAGLDGFFGFAGATGSGGNIFISGSGFGFGSDRTYFISGKPRGDNNITAKATFGNGGNISIRAIRLLDIARRSDDFVTTNDITTKSQFAFDGSVAIDTLNINPDVGTPPFVAGLVDASQLIAEGCDTRGKLALGRLVSTGRGGVAANPTDDTLISDDIATTWVGSNGQGSTAARPAGETQAQNQSAQNQSAQNQPAQNQLASDRPASGEEIIEAQGWIVESDGSVVLVAAAPNASPQIPWFGRGTCPPPQ
jgi:filamentous hemagglutinin family protein